MVFQSDEQKPASTNIYTRDMNACDTMPAKTLENDIDVQVKTKNDESLTGKHADSESEEKALQIIDGEDSNNNEAIRPASGLKREASSSSAESETKAKKVRNKPKPLIIENMKEYVENDTLEKLTTATLRHWLRQQSIHCTTRDKKADLVEKVRKHFVAT